MVKNITLCVIATLTLNGFSQISEKLIKKDITFLASDKLKGRSRYKNEETLKEMKLHLDIYFNEIPLMRYERLTQAKPIIELI